MCYGCRYRGKNGRSDGVAEGEGICELKDMLRQKRKRKNIQTCGVRRGRDLVFYNYRDIF
jgi:hypothetical protein